MSEELQTLSQLPPAINPATIPLHYFLPSVEERETLASSYKVLLGRGLGKHIPALSWMLNLNVLPNHIPHRYQNIMKRKSDVVNVALLFKNEAKYEDCVSILESCETALNEHHIEAHGKK